MQKFQPNCVYIDAHRANRMHSRQNQWHHQHIGTHVPANRVTPQQKKINEYLIEYGLLLDALAIGNKLNTNISLQCKSDWNIPTECHFQSDTHALTLAQVYAWDLGKN